MRTHTLIFALTLASALVATTGCSNYRESRGGPEGVQRFEDSARVTVRSFKVADPTITEFFENAHAYAIFPKVTKGAAGIGAANGEGVVFQGNTVIGYAELTQVNVGFQLGGQSFSQLIFFEDARALRNFKRGDLKFNANASAVAAQNGAAATNDYENGVAVFSMVRGGLMFEASIGGQDFDFEPVK